MPIVMDLDKGCALRPSASKGMPNQPRTLSDTPARLLTKAGKIDYGVRGNNLSNGTG
jgi:hypothetical protein